MRDLISRVDFCSYLVVAVFLSFVARAVANHLPRFTRGMVWSAIAALLLVGYLGFTEVRPRSGDQVFALLLVAWIASAAAALVAAVLLPPIVAVIDGWREMEQVWATEAQRRERDEKERTEREKAESERKAAESERKVREEAARAAAERTPPPPTKEERVAAARAVHEQTLALIAKAGLSESELHAATEKAKQDYLKQLDGIL
ncbi:MAG: hypothetical protein U0792_23975 [Gemmataceae bacterium]